MIEILLERNPQLFEINQGGFNLSQFLNKADELVGLNPNYELLKKEILDFFKENDILINDFNRNNLSLYWKSNNSFASKMLLTMWWGGISNQFQAPKFYRWNNFDSFAHIGEINCENIQELFWSFENIDSGFDGVGYRYFTKFMQFMPHKSGQQAIISDQWSMKAAAAYLISNKDLERLKWIFTSLNCDNAPDFRIRRRSKSPSYMEFLTVFEEMRKQVNQRLGKEFDLFRIEEGFFGWGHDINNPRNPRNLYHEIIGEHLGCR